MLFNSINFLVFFSVFYLIYTRVNLKIQNWLLLFGGIVFYSFWNYKMTFLLLFCIYFNFIAGIQLVKNQDAIKRKRILLFTIALNLGILFIFKYTVFVIQSFNDNKGEVVNAYLTKDQKWRMKTELEEISPILQKTIIAKEDKHFYSHPGVNPFAVVRAFIIGNNS